MLCSAEIGCVWGGGGFCYLESTLCCKASTDIMNHLFSCIASSLIVSYLVAAVYSYIVYVLDILDVLISCIFHTLRVLHLCIIFCKHG